MNKPRKPTDYALSRRVPCFVINAGSSNTVQGNSGAVPAGQVACADGTFGVSLTAP